MEESNFSLHLNFAYFMKYLEIHLELKIHLVGEKKKDLKKR